MGKSIFYSLSTVLTLTLNIYSSIVSFAGETLQNESIFPSFQRQLISFPQEKIYVQTDKPVYINGEDIWFRAYLVDHASLIPDTTSRYIYAELVSQGDSVIVRAKIRPVEGAYHGYLKIPEGTPEGAYDIRFYTRYMENIGEDYFFRKQIFIGDPLSALYRTNSKFIYENDHSVTTEIKFTDVSSGDPIIPTEVRVRTRDGQINKVNLVDGNILRLKLDPTRDLVNNTLYVEYDYDSKFHKEFIPVPPDDERYDVSFFPEGGNLPAGVLSRVAFKALKTNGLGEIVSGEVVDAQGNQIASFESNALGMGTFALMAQPGETYTAICKNSHGAEQKFKLPEAVSGIASLKTVWANNGTLNISINKADGYTSAEGMRLIIHSRGSLFYDQEWNDARGYVRFDRNMMPSGILNLLLIDKTNNPVSERLVFNLNGEDIAGVSFSTIKDNYGARELVTSTVKIADRDGEPLNGSFSVSVTDDRDVTPDSTNNILTALLITSELKGHIENPAHYFKGDVTAVADLDALMMTQGWRRYNVPALLKGEIETPKREIEATPLISGFVKEGLGRPAAGAEVTVAALDSILYFGTATTDRQGRFVFPNLEFPDSTQFFVQAVNKKGKPGTYELAMDKPEGFPGVSVRTPWKAAGRNGEDGGSASGGSGDPSAFEQYLAKADQKYLYINGIRTVYIKDVLITAKRDRRIAESYSAYSSLFNPSVKPEDYPIVKNTIGLVEKLPGVYIEGFNPPSIKLFSMGKSGYSVILDGMEDNTSSFLTIPLDLIEEIELVRGARMAMFGLEGGNKAGVFIVTTKARYIDPTRTTHQGSITPLGYQSPREFYSPKYETPEQKQNPNPDLRTTIYWNPDIKIGEAGITNLEFYLADNPSTYSVTIEGLTDDGRLIHTAQKINKAF